MNQQNIPRSGGYRECFVAPKGKVLVISDYSQQEARIAAAISSEPTMIELFKQNGDIHSLVGSKAYGGIEVSKTVNPELRQNGKTIGFLMLFGGQADKLSDSFQIPKKKAQELIDNYFASFPNLKKLFDTTYLETLSQGYILIDKYSGRRFYLPEYDKYVQYKILYNRYKSYNWSVPRSISSWLRRYENEIYRLNANYRIQGCAASITKLATIYITDYIDRKNLWDRIKIVNNIHDEIVSEVDKDLARVFAKLKKTYMEKAGRVFIKSLPISASPTISSYWNHD